MSSMDTMNSILSDLQEKYEHTERMLALTKKLETAARIRDELSIGEALDARQLELDASAVLDRRIKKSCELLPEPFRGRVSTILDPKATEVSLENPLEENIFDTNRRIIVLMRKIVTLDTAIREKIQQGK